MSKITITKENLCSLLTDNASINAWALFYLYSLIIRDDTEAEHLYSENLYMFIRTYYNDISVNDVMKNIHDYHKSKGYTQFQIDYANLIIV